jgi:hypothetical protein
MAGDESAGWSSLLDIADDGLTYTALNRPPAGRLLGAVARIRRERFAERWRKWIALLDVGEPAPLSAAGRNLLILFLQVGGSDSALDLDDGLYRLCGVRWAVARNRSLTIDWLGPLLVTLATRPAGKAFACAERLAHNPDTANFLQVRELYDHLVAEVAGEADVSRKTEGVDGYDLMKEPELYRQQLILDRYLASALPPRFEGKQLESAWNTEEMLPLLLRRQAEAEHTKFMRAAENRAQWLKDSSKPPEILAIRQTRIGEVAICGDDPYRWWRNCIDRLQRELLDAKPH